MNKQTYNINQTQPPPYSTLTYSKLAKKKTIKGEIRELNTVRALRELFPTDDSVLQAIFSSRLAKTSDKCPKCGVPISVHYRKMSNKLAYKCRFCNNKIHPLVSTPLERTHFPLAIIIELTFRMIISKHGFNAAEVAREYGCKPDTAWKILHRIRNWMTLCVKSYQFAPNEDIEMDEVFIICPTDIGREFCDLKRGPGSQRLKTVFTLTGRESGVTKAYVKEDKTSRVVQEVINEAGVTPAHHIKTDESTIYTYLTKDGYDHATCTHKTCKWVGDEDAHTNTLEGLHSLMKGAYYRNYKGVSKKHLEKYVNETVFNFSNRNKTALEAINELIAVLPPLFDTKSIS